MNGCVNAPGIVTAEQYTKWDRQAPIPSYIKKMKERPSIYEWKNLGAVNNQVTICDPVANQLPSGAVIHFFIGIQNILEIERIDVSLRERIESFAIAAKGDAQ